GGRVSRAAGCDAVHTPAQVVNRKYAQLVSEKGAFRDKAKGDLLRRAEGARHGVDSHVTGSITESRRVGWGRRDAIEHGGSRTSIHTNLQHFSRQGPTELPGAGFDGDDVRFSVDEKRHG